MKRGRKGVVGRLGYGMGGVVGGNMGEGLRVVWENGEMYGYLWIWENMVGGYLGGYGWIERMIGGMGEVGVEVKEGRV